MKISRQEEQEDCLAALNYKFKKSPIQVPGNKYSKG